MANGIFGVGGPLGPLAPGMSPMINPLALAGMSMAQGSAAPLLAGAQLAQNAQARQEEIDYRNRLLAIQMAERNRQMEQAQQAQDAIRVGLPSMVNMLAPGVADQFSAETVEMVARNPGMMGPLLKAVTPQEGKSEPLVNVMVNGRPTMLPRSQAAGLPTAYTPSAPKPIGETGLSQEDTFKWEQGLRKEFQGESTDFQKLAAAYGKVQAAEATAAGDVSLIYGYMRLLDPASTVREGEFATAEQAQGVPGRIVSAYNRAVSGERLNDDVRADFKRQARRVAQSALGQQENLIAQYTGLAERAGVSPENVITRYFTESQIQDLLASEPAEDVTAGGTETPPPEVEPIGAERVLPDGRRIRKIGPNAWEDVRAPELEAGALTDIGGF